MIVLLHERHESDWRRRMTSLSFTAVKLQWWSNPFCRSQLSILLLYSCSFLCSHLVMSWSFLEMQTPKARDPRVHCLVEKVYTRLIRMSASVSLKSLSSRNEWLQVRLNVRQASQETHVCQLWVTPNECMWYIKGTYTCSPETQTDMKHFTESWVTMQELKGPVKYKGKVSTRRWGRRRKMSIRFPVPFKMKNILPVFLCVWLWVDWSRYWEHCHC